MTINPLSLLTLMAAAVATTIVRNRRPAIKFEASFPRDAAGDRRWSFEARVALLLLLLCVGALLTYKTRGAIATLAAAQSTGSVRSGRFLLNASASWSDVLAATWTYFAAVWPALVFGILISAAVRSLLAAGWFEGIFSRRSLTSHVTAGLAGAPLMLCSCCVTSIFHAAVERSSNLGPALALMLSSPALNPAALALTLVMFGPTLGVVRLLAGVTLVFAVSRVIGRLSESRQPATTPRNIESPSFLSSLAVVTWRTVPLVVLGVIAAMAWLHIVPIGVTRSIPLVAAAALPLALPTFAEIPLALLLVSAGAPVGAAMAMFIAGPTVNLPSLLSVAKVAGWRACVALAISVWSVAAAAGFLVQLLSAW
jgi:uncharacterized protein